MDKTKRKDKERSVLAPAAVSTPRSAARQPQDVNNSRTKTCFETLVGAPEWMGKLCNGCKTSLPEPGNVGSLNLSGQNRVERGGGDKRWRVE